MNYQRIQIPKAVIYLTTEEINRLLMKDPELFALALKRGKGISRAEKQRQREEDLL